jgi:hypothetical protein
MNGVLILTGRPTGSRGTRHLENLATSVRSCVRAHANTARIAKRCLSRVVMSAQGLAEVAGATCQCACVSSAASDAPVPCALPSVAASQPPPSAWMRATLAVSRF